MTGKSLDLIAQAAGSFEQPEGKNCTVSSNLGTRCKAVVLTSSQPCL